MKHLTEELWFDVPTRRAFINITPQVEELVQQSGVQEGLCLVNAMHITASVFINDDESGLHSDYERWLEELDVDGNGAVEFDEFMAFYNSKDNKMRGKTKVKLKLARAALVQAFLARHSRARMANTFHGIFSEYIRPHCSLLQQR